MDETNPLPFLDPVWLAKGANIFLQFGPISDEDTKNHPEKNFRKGKRA